MTEMRMRSSIVRQCRWLTALLATVVTSVAGATSGIQTGQILVHSGSMTPSCTEETINIFKIDVENTNSVCNEMVKISEQGILVECLSDTCDFLGFSLDSSVFSSGGVGSDALEFEAVDESTYPVYFAVRTFPNSRGCIFDELSLQVTVCDVGGPCIGDWFDGPRCEDPTAYTHNLTVAADEVLCPSTFTGVDEALVSGVVTDALGDAIKGARVELSYGCPSLSGAYYSEQTYTEVTDFGTRLAGSFEFKDVPQAASYTLVIKTDEHYEELIVDILDSTVSLDVEVDW